MPLETPESREEVEILITMAQFLNLSYDQS